MRNKVEALPSKEFLAEQLCQIVQMSVRAEIAEQLPWSIIEEAIENPGRQYDSFLRKILFQRNRIFLEDKVGQVKKILRYILTHKSYEQSGFTGISFTLDDGTAERSGSVYDDSDEQYWFALFHDGVTRDEALASLYILESLGGRRNPDYEKRIEVISKRQACRYKSTSNRENVMKDGALLCGLARYVREQGLSLNSFDWDDVAQWTQLYFVDSAPHELI